MQGGLVRAISECFIKPKNVADDESKKKFYLGSFELLQMCHFYLQKGLLFHKPTPREGHGCINPEFLERLKQSLSTTLHQFYPLAGQLVTEVDLDKHESFIYVDCVKGPGAKFIHATLNDVNVDDIISSNYVPTIVQSCYDLGRIPRNYDAHDEPILVVQVTELVDGVFLGISVNHSVVDGTTLWHFLSTWSEIFQLDVDDTTIISRPPICERWFPEGHGPILKIPHIHPDEFIEKSSVQSNDDLTEMIFHMSSESIASLKAKANSDCGVVNKISSFQVLSATIWRSIVRARQGGVGEDSMCLIVANARSRVVPPLSQNYLGSFAIASFNHMKVSELIEDSLGKVSLLVHQAVEELTHQHMLDTFLQWIHSPYFATVGQPSPNSVIISGTPREEACNIEFGLGKAVAVRTGSNKYDGKVVLHPGIQGQGSVSIQICLSSAAMLALQQDKQFVSLLS